MFPAARPTFDEAIDIVLAHAPAPRAELVPLDRAFGRIAVGAVRAQTDYPRLDCSAMDGFALAAAQATASGDGSLRLPLSGEARAGHPRIAVAPGDACRISTGAALPIGCDTVVAREFACIEAGTVRLDLPIVAGQNVRRRGEDIVAGALVVGDRTVITPEIVGAMACYGIDTVRVARAPRLILLSTGDELAGAADAADPVRALDANGPMIAAMAAQLGIVAERLPVVRDDPSLVQRALEAAMARGAELVVSTGGISAGDHDHLPHALATLGAQLHFRGVAIRPGKPVLAATLPSGALFFGLPGNPVAAASGFRFLVAPVIRAMLGFDREYGREVALDYPVRPGTTLLLRATRTVQRDGSEQIDVADEQRSHIMRSLVGANCWIAADLVDASPRYRCYPMVIPLTDPE